ncbi:MAG TPA: nucleotide exchange factor GrpE [Candidatus Limnocylindrales bacterium]|jgi:molecular chaperone GrpE
MRSDRSRTRAEERVEELDISPTKLLADIEALQGERDAAQAQAADYLLALQRERAEFQNFKRRTAEERDRESGLANDLLLFKVLILADDFDRAIEALPAGAETASWVDGVVAIDRKLRQLLESEGLRPIEVTPGMAFDPREHEALVNVPTTEVPEGSIVAELQRGYRIRDRILRPARVAIAASPDPDAAGDDAARPLN